MGLTAKQRLFVHEYPIDWNATQAAIRAGYSPKTAYSIGFENLKKPEIKAAISEVVKARIMSAEETLARISNNAKGDIGPFMDVELDGTVRVDVAKMKEQGKTHLLKRIKQRKIITETTNERSGKTTVTTDFVCDFEMHDAQSALGMMGKHHKLFVDRTELTDGEGKPLIAKELFEKALEKIYGHN